MTRKLRPKMSEEQIVRAIELNAHGYSGADISTFLDVPYQSVIRELRKRGLTKTTTRSKVEEGMITESHEKMLELTRKSREQVAVTPIAEAPIDTAALENRTETLAKTILLGAERLISSINSMTDEQLATASLSNKATALGILVDKIKVITNKAQPMFGAGANGQTINIINVIASAASSRRKGSAEPEFDAEDITPI